MAKIVTITNPLTGQPAQVDQLDHTAQQIDDAISRALPGGYYDKWVSQLPSQNLLDNWYFADPINQRGATDGSYTNAYTIDRWKLLNIGYVTFNDGYITIKSKDGYPPYFSQFFDDAFLKSIVGKQVTLSALMRGAADECGIEMFGRFYAYSTSADNWNVVTKTVTVPSDITTIRVGVRNLDMVGDVPLDVQAMKLELGDHQTLAHQDADGNWVLNDPPPNKQQELAKCQRYFIRLGYPNEYCAVGMGQARTTGDTVYCVSIPVTMRTVPSVSVAGKIEFRYGSTYSYSNDCNVEGNGQGSLLCFSVVTAPSQGAACDIYLAPGNYLDFYAEL